MGSKKVLRRDFLRKSGLAAAGIAVVLLMGGASGSKPAGDTHILLTGDIHFDLPGDHNMEWVDENNHTHEINRYCMSTAKSFKPLMATLKKQSLSASPPVQAVIQVGDFLEGLAGSPEMAEQMTRHLFEALDEAAIPAPWIIAQGNHERTGHQAVSATTAVENNFTVVTLPNGITVAHSGGQSWADDFVWIDSVHNDVAIDVLMVNNWTLWPDRVLDGLQPVVTLPGHVNEMGHGIGIDGGRIPFWKSDLSWQNGGSGVVHLFWGEPYVVEEM